VEFVLDELTSIKIFVECLINEIDLLIESQDKSRNESSIPKYLHKESENLNLIKRSLKSLVLIVSKEKNAMKTIGSKGMLFVVMGILYCPRYIMGKSFPLYERVNANNLRGLITQDNNTLIKKIKDFFKIDFSDTALMSKLEKIICFHKMAAYVMGKKLTNDNYNFIMTCLKNVENKQLIIGLLAAVTLDSTNRYRIGDEKDIDAAKIFKCWKDIVNGENYTGDDAVNKTFKKFKDDTAIENILILYSRPLMEVTIANGCEDHKYSITDLENYLKLFKDYFKKLTEESRTKIRKISERENIFLTINYEQHLYFSEFPKGYLSDNTKNVEFAEYEYNKVKKEDYPMVFELKMTLEEENNRILGINKTNNSDKSSVECCEYLYEIIMSEKRKYDQDDLYFKPYESYFPIPIIDRYLEIKALSCKLCKSNNISLKEIEIKYYGIISENDYTQNIEIPFYNIDDCNERKVRFNMFMIRYVVAKITNYSVLYAVNNIAIKCKDDLIKKSIDDMLNDEKYGFHLLVKYCSQYSRVNRFITEFDSVEIQKFQSMVKNPRLLEKLSIKKKLSIGIDIGGTTIKFALMYENTLEKIIRIPTIKNTKNVDKKYASLD
jgi:hypothetical protein